MKTAKVNALVRIAAERSTITVQVLTDDRDRETLKDALAIDLLGKLPADVFEVLRGKRMTASHHSIRRDVPAGYDQQELYVFAVNEEDARIAALVPGVMADGLTASLGPIDAEVLPRRVPWPTRIEVLMVPDVDGDSEVWVHVCHNDPRPCALPDESKLPPEVLDVLTVEETELVAGSSFVEYQHNPSDEDAFGEFKHEEWWMLALAS